MKLNKIVLISIFFLAFFMMSAISADTGSTDINVTFTEKVYEQDLGDISVEMPENTTGNLKATVDDVEIYSENITGTSVKIPISIPKSNAMIAVNKMTDHTSHRINVFHNDVLLNSSHTLKVMKFNRTHDYGYGIPSQILKDDDSFFHSAVLVFPESANGTVEVYVDGKFLSKLNTTPFTNINISNLNRLDLADHIIRIVYSGDDYYFASERTYNFTVVDAVINIPQNIVLEHDDCVVFKTLENKNGNLSIIIDGEEKYSSKLDENGEFLKSLFDLITSGNHSVEVRYSADNFTRFKRQSVNVTYYIDVEKGNFRYGSGHTLSIIVPVDFNRSLIDLSIDGAAVKDFSIDDSGWIELDVSGLSGGNHTLEFNFKGDAKYYPQSVVSNFTVDYEITVDDLIEYCDGSCVALTLPDGANGSLDVIIDGVLYESVKMIKGKASIDVSCLSCGEYELYAAYEGSDFDVSSLNTTVSVGCRPVSPYVIYEGQNSFMMVEVGKGAKGKVIFDNVEIPVKNGKALFSLKNLKLGEHYIDISYISDSGFVSDSYSYVNVIRAKITNAKNVNMKYLDKVKYSIKAPVGIVVKFKIGKKVIEAKANSKGIAGISLANLAPGKYDITISYKSTRISKKVNVKHMLSLKTVKVKKSAKKIVLTVKAKKSLKSKWVTFKFNGKTYKSKISSKGIAKVTIKKSAIKKLKVGKKITYSATYLKDTVKRTVKVKR